jgi:hypothetical protein
MKFAKAAIRDRLVGQPLIGFDTRPEVVDAPRAKVGGVEIAPRAKVGGIEIAPRAKVGTEIAAPRAKVGFE